MGICKLQVQETQKNEIRLISLSNLLLWSQSRAFQGVRGGDWDCLGGLEHY